MGHAVSTDLVRWQELPVALEPDELEMIFSGCAVVDEEDTSGLFGGGSGLVAIYTSAGETQQQSIAYSTDRGRTWTKYSGNPVIPNPGVADFRDPKVFWHSTTANWVMSLAVGDRIRFYGSPDLIHWVRLSEFGSDQGAHGGVWECPDLFRLPVEDGSGDKWVLIVSLNPGGPAGGSGMQYFIGEFDGTTFTNDNPADDVRWVDHGSDFYAAVTWSGVPDRDGRRLWVGWMNNWDYAQSVPTSPWRGSMSVPRRLGLVPSDSGVRLVQQPVRELERGRSHPRRWAGKLTERESGPEFAGTSLDIDVEFGLESASATSFGIDVFAGEQRHTRIGFDFAAAELFIDRRESGRTPVSPSFPARHVAAHSSHGKRLRIRVLIDRCGVEVFGDEGRAVLTDLVFPDPANRRVRLFGIGGQVRVESLRIFDLHAPDRRNP